MACTHLQELGLSDEVADAIRRSPSPSKKAAKLAGALRSQQFMARLQVLVRLSEGALPAGSAVLQEQTRLCCTSCRHSTASLPRLPPCLQHDLSTREGRLAALEHKLFLREQEEAAQAQERSDLAAAQAHFSQLGWPKEALQAAADGSDSGAASAASAPADALLGGLLRRAAALQEARQLRGSEAGVDWAQPEWQ